MKAIPKVNTEGLYIEDALADDAFTGVVPFYADPPAPKILPETDTAAEDEQPDEPEIAGYIVGVPVPPGLYLPRFDLVAWDADNSGEPEDYWTEGLTAEEIEDLTRQPEPAPDAADYIAVDLVQKELEILELKKQNAAMGEQIVAQELASRDIATQYDALGKTLVTLELKVLGLTTIKGGGE